MEYRCLRCGYETKYKQNLLTHLRKKIECEELIEEVSREELIKSYEKKEKIHKCEKCKKEFSNSQNARRHEKSCKVVVDETKQLKEELAEIKNQIKELIKNQKTSVINNTNNTTNITNTGPINYNIIINNLRAFGDENREHISRSELKEIVKYEEILIYKELIAKIYLNKDHPENWNYLINDMDTKGNGYIYNGKEFKQVKIERIIDMLLKNNMEYILEKLGNFREKLTVTWYGNIVERHKDIRKETYNEIKNLSYTNKKNVEKLKEEFEKLIEEEESDSDSDS